MRAVQERCEVELDKKGRPRLVRWRGRAYRVTRGIDQYRAGGRWWLSESSRDCWLLECGHLTVEIHRFDESDPPQEVSGWWVARVQD